MNKDRYPNLGLRVDVEGFDKLLGIVQDNYYNAYAEGSTGSERSYFVQNGAWEPTLVAHSWPVRGSETRFWLRIAEPNQSDKLKALIYKFVRASDISWIEDRGSDQQVKEARTKMDEAEKEMLHYIDFEMD